MSTDQEYWDACLMRTWRQAGTVMDAIQNLGQEITVIIVAHRLSSVRHCDCIFFLEKGKLSGQGTFDELVKVNKRFNDLAEKR